MTQQQKHKRQIDADKKPNGPVKKKEADPTWTKNATVKLIPDESVAPAPSKPKVINLEDF